ncbi:hypothetical protein ACMDCT_09150 [Halomonadaceae bacterium KBTZ08]
MVGGLRERINTPHKISQQGTSLCGPSVYLYVLAKQYPAVYAQYIVDLFSKGEARIGNLVVKPSKACRSYDYSEESVRIHPVDWIGAASLRDSSNAIFAYDHPSDAASGITLPSHLESWFKTSGFASSTRNTNLIFDKGIGNLAKASLKFDSGHNVCLFVGATMLYSSAKKGLVPADHWVVMNSRPLIDGKPLSPALIKRNPDDLSDRKISFDVYTWGHKAWSVNKFRRNLTVAEFLDYYYGFVSAGPRTGNTTGANR